MTASVTDLTAWKPKHRRPRPSTPAPLFPGSDPMGDPFYTAVASDLRALGFGRREFDLTFAGLPGDVTSRLAAAWTATGAVRAAGS